ncbi:MAG TPA: GNAT family N-acetyltransferase [Acidimicrobiia bacterium]|nr:GNAT family N-acetyltransferase [Acidimicrobiia bacterium]
MNVRRLQAGDADALRGVRLRALLDAPDAFWTTYEREAASESEYWRRWIDSAALFVAEDGVGCAGGMAGGIADPDDPAAALLIAMWVAPEHRGSVLADKLVAAVADWAAAERRPNVRLNVEEHNHRARRCYERLGFQLTGRRNRRDRDGRFELEMVLHVERPRTG